MKRVGTRRQVFLGKASLKKIFLIISMREDLYSNLIMVIKMVLSGMVNLGAITLFKVEIGKGINREF